MIVHNAQTEQPEQPGSASQVLVLATPIAVSLFCNAAVGAVDTLLVGQVSTSHQAAVGAGAVIAFTLMALCCGVITATGTVVSQLLGAGRSESCGRVCWQALHLAIIGALLVELLLAPHADALVELFVTDAHVARLAASYLTVRLHGTGFALCSYCVVCFLRATGDAITPMKVGILVNIVNLAATYVLVLGPGGLPRLGATGAAAGTVLSQAVAVGIYLVFLLQNKTHRRYCTRDEDSRRFSWKLSVELLRLGVPTGLRWTIQMGMWSALTAYAATFGSTALAAHQVVKQVLHLITLPLIGLSESASVLVGRFVGAGRVPLAARSSRTAVFIAVAITVTATVVITALRRPIAELFSNDVAVVKLTSDLFLVAFGLQIFEAVGTVCCGALRGAGDTRWPMRMSIATAWLIGVPSALLLGRMEGVGPRGVWMGATLQAIAFAMALVIRLGRMWRSGVVGPLKLVDAATTV